MIPDGYTPLTDDDGKVIGWESPIIRLTDGIVQEILNMQVIGVDLATGQDVTVESEWKDGKMVGERVVERKPELGTK